MGEEVRKVIFRLLIDKDQPEEITAIVHERTPLIDEIEGLSFGTAWLTKCLAMLRMKS